jgi:hypothetical protein
MFHVEQLGKKLITLHKEINMLLSKDEKRGLPIEKIWEGS